MVDEEEIQFGPEGWIVFLECWVATVKESTCGIVVVYHNLFVFCNILHKARTVVDILVLPHLQNVDDLPHIVARSFNQVTHHVIIEFEVLLSTYHLNTF